MPKPLQVGADAIEPEGAGVVAPIRLERLVLLERPASSGERRVRVVRPVLEAEHHRLRKRDATGPPAPVLTAARQLPAALDMRARLREPPALRPDAREVRPHPQLEV